MLDSITWSHIDNRIEAHLSDLQQPLITQSTVVKNDKVNNIIWADDYGDIPIPFFSFDYEVTYYDERPSSANVTSGQPAPRETKVKKAHVKVLCPEVGDIVLILRQHGSRNLPKCVGVLRSKNFVGLTNGI